MLCTAQSHCRPNDAPGALNERKIDKSCRSLTHTALTADYDLRHRRHRSLLPPPYLLPLSVPSSHTTRRR